MFWHIFDLNFDCVLGEGLPHKMHFNVEENKSLSSFFHKKKHFEKKKTLQRLLSFYFEYLFEF